MAQTAQEDRRIEEEKRKSLHQTEVLVPAMEEQVARPDHLIDRSYFEKLVSRKISYRRDGCMTLAVLMGVEKQYPNLDSQIAFMKERGIIPPKYTADFSPDEPLRKGLAAYMFYEALGIDGGLWIRLFGISQRYALKELVFEGIMISGNKHDIVSGEELISILAGCADFMTKWGLVKQEVRQ